MADEPTTGLDAFGAERVVRLLRNLAMDHGFPAVITLHQVCSKLRVLNFVRGYGWSLLFRRVAEGDAMATCKNYPLIPRDALSSCELSTPERQRPEF